MFPKNCNGTLVNATDLNYTSTAMMNSISTTALTTTMDTPASPEDFLLDFKTPQFIFFSIFSNRFIMIYKEIWDTYMNFISIHAIKFIIILYILFIAIIVSNSEAQLDQDCES